MKKHMLGSELAEAIQRGETVFQGLQVKGDVDLRGLNRAITDLSFTDMSFIGDLSLERAVLRRLLLKEVSFCKRYDEDHGLILRDVHASKIDMMDVNVTGLVDAINLSVEVLTMRRSSVNVLDFRSALFGEVADFSEIQARLVFFDSTKADRFKVSHFEVRENVSFSFAKIENEFELFGLSVGGCLNLTEVKSGCEIRFMEHIAGLFAKVEKGVICGNDIALALKCLAFFGPKGTRVSADFSGVAVALDVLSKMKPTV